MGFWRLFFDMLPYIIAAWLLGLCMGWLVNRRKTTAAAISRESWETKIREYESDLDTVRADLHSHKDRITALRSELTAANGALSARDVELAALQARLDDVGEIEAQLDQQKTETAGHQAEIELLRTQLVDAQQAAEEAASRPPAPDPKMVEEIQGLTESLEARNAEVQTLLIRVKELAPLTLQLKDRDLKLSEAAEKHLAALNLKDEEIAGLNSRMSELEQVRILLSDRDARIAELESTHASDQQQLSELAILQVRMAEMESQFAAALAEKENDLVQLRGRLSSLIDQQSVVDERGAEIERLREQVGQLEGMSRLFVEKDPQKDAEIDRLGSRIAELEGLNSVLSDRDARIAELQGQVNELDVLRSSIDSKDVEIGRLQERASELDALNGAIGQKNEQIGILERRIIELEPLPGLIDEKDQELHSLRNHIRELESLGAQLAERDSRIGEFQVQLARYESEISDFRSSAADLGELTRLQAQVGDLESQLQATRANQQPNGSARKYQLEIESLRARVRDLETMYSHAMHPPAKSEWDDLKLIHGVGPVLEKMLHKLGIYTFRQIALWGDEQIDWVDAQLENFHGRIRRENWIDSAREGHFNKYNEKL